MGLREGGATGSEEQEAEPWPRLHPPRGEGREPDGRGKHHIVEPARVQAPHECSAQPANGPAQEDPIPRGALRAAQSEDGRDEQRGEVEQVPGQELLEASQLEGVTCEEVESVEAVPGAPRGEACGDTEAQERAGHEGRPARGHGKSTHAADERQQRGLLGVNRERAKEHAGERSARPEAAPGGSPHEEEEREGRESQGQGIGPRHIEPTTRPGIGAGDPACRKQSGAPRGCAIRSRTWRARAPARQGCAAEEDQQGSKPGGQARAGQPVQADGAQSRRERGLPWAIGEGGPVKRGSHIEGASRGETIGGENRRPLLPLEHRGATEPQRGDEDESDDEARREEGSAAAEGRRSCAARRRAVRRGHSTVALQLSSPSNSWVASASNSKPSPEAA